MIKKYSLILLIALSVSFLFSDITAQETLNDTYGQKSEEELDIKELILGHLADAYQWHLFTWNEQSYTIHLPVILYSKTYGWNLFSSSKLEHVKSLHSHFYIASSGDYAGKIVERNIFDEEVRPLDLSLTKNAASLLISSFLLIVIILSIAKRYKNDTLDGEKGFAGAVEFLIYSITNEVIKPSIGKEYKRFAPYVLTLLIKLLLLLMIFV